ncbi:MAG: hypothetical protein H7246_04790 [Phycisphaerae bacterium]|nr:hypothetical protein [Saprospiraceae bacterium]
MKHFLPALFLTLTPILNCLAQDIQDRPQNRSPKLIVQTGLGLQLRGELYKFSVLSIETPLDDFWQVGIQGSHVFPKPNNNGYSFGGSDYDKFLGGFEVGSFAKFFLHGKYSGRKSVLYCGGEIRFGAIQSGGQLYGDLFPTVYTYKTTQRTQKYLVRWGTQWRFGRYAILEVALPFGWQHSEFTSKTTENGVERIPPPTRNGKFVILPTFQLGVAF